MVSKIHLSQNITKALMYNEKKVELGLAKCLIAENMILSPTDLTTTMKRNLLNLWSTINANITNNAVHISISFHPLDQHIITIKLTEIARQFMTMIGFGKQPYLVYQHMDTSIPHAHIVTTNVQYPSEKGIDQHYIIYKKFLPANQAIEKQYNLITTEQAIKQKPNSFAVPSKHISYGRVATKQAMEEVICFMRENYSFTSLTEWNALLYIFHVKAIHLAENNKRLQAGLMYKLLDENMKPIGVPLLASKLSTKPTLQNLGEFFKKNSISRHEQIAKITVELTLLNGEDLDKKTLVDGLALQGIDLIQLRQNSKSPLESVYIDHHNRFAMDEKKLDQEFHLKNLIRKETKLTSQTMPLRKMKQLRHGKTIR